MGILGVVTMPFGFDAVFWRLMGDGIDWMIRVALWISALPGAVGRMPAFGTGPLLTGTGGLLLVCLLRTPFRWCGAILLVGAGLCAVATPRPDVLVANDGQAVAMRGRDGRLSVLHSGRDSFAIKEWLAADADARTPKDPSLSDGVSCDAIGCIGKLGDGRFVAMALEVEAFAEDCARAAVVVSARQAPSASCAAILIDRAGRWRVSAALDWRTVRKDRHAPRRSRSTMDTCRQRSCIQRAGVRFARRRDAETGNSRSGRLVAPKEADQLSLNAHAIGRQDAHLIGCVGGFERYRGAAAAKTFQCGFLVIDERHHDIAGVCRFRFADQRNVSVKDARLDHAVAADLEGEVVPGRQQVGRHIDDMAASLDRLDGSAGGNAAHDRYSNRPPAIILGCCAHASKIAFDHAGREPA
jgi:hypothetical protein